MKKLFTLNLLLILFLLAPAFESLAQTTGTWDALGTVKAARMGGDHDLITVSEPHDKYTKLKFKVDDAPLNIKKMVITYESGESQIINTSYQIKKGGESNIINLKSGGQKLQSVELWYDTKGLLKGKSHVTVYGLK